MKIDKISHPIHPQHILKLENTQIPFKCDGCKEFGIGLEYSCQKCNFDLHTACAMPSLTITHPFFEKCEFLFHYKPPEGKRWSCDACGNDVQGFVYHCNRRDYHLHPSCANLPRVLNDGEQKLYRYPKLSGPCHCCGGTGPGWSYRSECKSYNLHVSCVKKLLAESWLVKYLNADNKKVKEMQTRIPSLKGTPNHHTGREGKVKKIL